MHGIDQRDDCVEQVALRDCLVHEEGLRDRARLGQPGSFDDDALEAEFPGIALLHQLAKDANQVAADGTADAAVVHFDDLLFA